MRVLIVVATAVVATALPTMGRVFRDVENLSWVVTAYLLTATASTPGFLARRIG